MQIKPNIAVAGSSLLVAIIPVHKGLPTGVSCQLIAEEISLGRWQPSLGDPWEPRPEGDCSAQSGPYLWGIGTEDTERAKS